METRQALRNGIDHSFQCIIFVLNGLESSSINRQDVQRKTETERAATITAHELAYIFVRGTVFLFFYSFHAAHSMVYRIYLVPSFQLENFW